MTYTIDAPPFWHREGFDDIMLDELERWIGEQMCDVVSLSAVQVIDAQHAMSIGQEQVA